MSDKKQFLDLSVIDMNYPFFLRFKQGHHLITCKVILEEFNVRSKTDITNNVFMQAINPFISHKVEMHSKWNYR